MENICYSISGYEFTDKDPKNPKTQDSQPQSHDT